MVCLLSTTCSTNDVIRWGSFRVVSFSLACLVMSFCQIPPVPTHATIPLHKFKDNDGFFWRGLLTNSGFVCLLSACVKVTLSDVVHLHVHIN